MESLKDPFLDQSSLAFTPYVLVISESIKLVSSAMRTTRSCIFKNEENIIHAFVASRKWEFAFKNMTSGMTQLLTVNLC